MRPFAYLRAGTPAAAARLLREPGTRVLAGGTDLLREMKSRLVAPDRLLDLGRVGEWRGLTCSAKEGLRAGSMVRLGELEASAELRARYPALHQAIAGAATPQVRNLATLGGSLLQRPSCWYYRRGLPCWLRGQRECSAAEGDNRHGGIFGPGPCIAGHPSDTAAALLALGATLRVTRRGRERSLDLAELYRLPSAADPVEHALGPEDLIAAIEVAPPRRDSRSVFLRARDRATWAFALVGVAAAARVVRGRLLDLRVVASGVGPIPWRIADPDRPAAGAAPHPTSAYKAAILETLVERARQALLAGD